MSHYAADEAKARAFAWTLGKIGALSALAVVSVTMVGCPSYNVYSSKMSGKAAYAKAEQNRRIKVLEASAAKDSAKMLGEAALIRAEQAALAEIARAKGTAEANKIVADGLGGPEGYLRYLYIDKLSNGKGREVIYIPTEAGLPILEAGKR